MEIILKEYKKRLYVFLIPIILSWPALMFASILEFILSDSGTNNFEINGFFKCVIAGIITTLPVHILNLCLIERLGKTRILLLLSVLEIFLYSLLYFFILIGGL